MAGLTDFKGKLQRLVQLGDQSEDVAREVFSRDVFSNILNLFSEKEHQKLSKATRIHGRYTEERMEYILKRLKEKREDANLLDKERMQKEKREALANGSRSHPSQKTSPLVKQADSRICKELEKKGGHTGSSWTTWVENWLGMYMPVVRGHEAGREKEDLPQDQDLLDLPEHCGNIQLHPSN